MTVKELIKALKTEDQDSIVVIHRHQHPKDDYDRVRYLNNASMASNDYNDRNSDYRITSKSSLDKIKVVVLE